MFRNGAQPRYEVYSATDLSEPIYRVAMTCPPTEDDFKSYLQGGKSFPPKLYFRALAVSMWRTEKEAKKLARNGDFGTCVARVELNNEDRVFVALTNERTGPRGCLGLFAFSYQVCG